MNLGLTDLEPGPPHQCNTVGNVPGMSLEPRNISSVLSPYLKSKSTSCRHEFLKVISNAYLTKETLLGFSKKEEKALPGTCQTFLKVQPSGKASSRTPCKVLMELLWGLSLDSVSTHRHMLEEHPREGRKRRCRQAMLCRCKGRKQLGVAEKSVLVDKRGTSKGTQRSHTDQIKIVSSVSR